MVLRSIRRHSFNLANTYKSFRLFPKSFGSRLVGKKFQSTGHVPIKQSGQADARAILIGNKIEDSISLIKFVCFGVKSHIGPPLCKVFAFLNHTCFGYGSGRP